MDALFRGGDSSGVDTVDEQEFDLGGEHDGLTGEPADEKAIGWRVLVLLVVGALAVTGLAVAFMVWVIEALVL
ncbi:hypothetical protein SAMN05216553_102614 [Lentzea fradiae]|uniref:Uncharacterized protein n=1 Tax=Lentzea fradiae TaxID=200378 RepID=A0A1G7N0X2_9PSEU|nr:hypothetical protein [Lentzea fradiae]SDF67612.1 hypothetical protein SAMN05216553_102614 [Lentzea fradiae]